MSGDNGIKNFLWDWYKHEVELHRSYLDLVMKVNTFYYAITGAVVSFYFLNVGREPLIKLSLLLPLVMSIALAIFYYKCARAADVSQDNLDKISQQMQLDVGSVVCRVLASLLNIFFILFVITALGLCVLLFKEYLLGLVT
jgi:hypothetical protein